MKINCLTCKHSILSGLLIAFVFSLSANAATWFVDQANTGSEDGTSWATAFTVMQPAIDAAFGDGGGDVWVAQGTYSEVRVSPFHSPLVDTGSIIMQDGINLFGGFAGNETLLSQQDITANPTTIDGSTARGGLPAFHVILGAANIVIDGFIITGGIGNSFFPQDSKMGAGIFSFSGPMLLRNLTFTDNHSPNFGGAVLTNQDLTIDSCSFSGNTAGSAGGAVFSSGTCTILNSIFTNNRVLSVSGAGGGALGINASTGTISGCTFENNRAGQGGAAFLSVDNATITNCQFIRNRSTGGGFGGGAISMGNNIGFPFENYTIENCVFYKNTSLVKGGAISIIGVDAGGLTTTCDIQTSTFYGNNTSAGDGGAVYVDIGDVTIANSIFSGNSGAEIKNLTSPSEMVTYSIVDGGHVGTGNLDVNPYFVNVVTGDLRLLSISPAIDAGTLTGAPSDDVNGNLRPQGAGVDMGAYESNPAIPLLSAASRAALTLALLTLLTAGAIALRHKTA